eukprot:Rmarinus@m.26150
MVFIGKKTVRKLGTHFEFLVFFFCFVFLFFFFLLGSFFINVGFVFRVAAVLLHANPFSCISMSCSLNKVVPNQKKKEKEKDSLKSMVVGICFIGQLNSLSLFCFCFRFSSFHSP